jgi:hypothetical protein
VQEVENRGDVIKKIKGCMGASATLASTGHPAPAAARTAPAATSSQGQYASGGTGSIRRQSSRRRCGHDGARFAARPGC